MSAPDLAGPETMNPQPLLPGSPARLVGWWALAVAPVVGVVIGVVARGWMRLLSTDPEFSWSGTVFIAGAFGVGGLAHALAGVGRRGRRRWSTPARVAAAVMTLPLFAGAGLIMLPTVVGASLATWRRGWPRVVRLVAAAPAVPAPAIVAVEAFRDGLGPGRLFGLVLMAATYASVVWASWTVTAPVPDGWRPGRIARIVAVGLGTSGLVGLALLMAGLVLVGD